MNKKTLSIVGIIVVIVVAVVVFVATQNGHKASTDPTSTASENKTLRFSDIALSSKPTIWYQGYNSTTDDITLTRKTDIRTIYVLQNGKITTYGNVDTTIDKINKMSDKSIIALAKKQNKEYFNDRAKEYLASFDDKGNWMSNGETITQGHINTGKQNIKSAKYTMPKPKAINITAYNNGQNKKPITEKFQTTTTTLEGTGDAYGFDGTLHITYSTTRDDSVELSSQSQYNNEVDGTKYNGYGLDFFTKVKSSKTMFALDTEKSKLIKHQKQSEGSAY
ncbi:hypothetical protein [Leuconostoc falkenbergense]|uniref:hypothetical protein n=1 Tax=Leuconostoc falkenbergense TaxID=2766470 RepID=UPI0024A7F5A8|nr:hypothetical protein [Leuconostoc falkenbergense]MDI6553884.1 hypothetical protein [Leuconostoc falkenbergense]